MTTAIRNIFMVKETESTFTFMFGVITIGCFMLFLLYMFVSTYTGMKVEVMDYPVVDRDYFYVENEEGNLRKYSRFVTPSGDICYVGPGGLSCIREVTGI